MELQPTVHSEISNTWQTNLGEELFQKEIFGGRDWAARSPDLNPLDYGNKSLPYNKIFLLLSGIWGILKARVNSPRPRTMLELRLRLDAEINRLGPGDRSPEKMCCKYCNTDKCLGVRGRYFKN